MHVERIWLASYPRSGNTFLRVLLNAAFDTVVNSKYDEDYSAFSKKFGELLGHGKRNNFNIIKTHEVESDEFPTIYVVRDGRASVVSYYHFCRNFETTRTMRDIISGITPFGSWSAHFRGWKPNERANTLLLRFEDITADPSTAVRQIGEFLGVEPGELPDVSFGALQKSSPEFFRSGSNECNIVEIDGESIELFDEIHGDLMRELGYYPECSKKER